MRIFKKFSFDSAHFLPHVPAGHKCKELHGHTYRMTLYFEGELDKKLGWVIDFADIKAVVSPVLKQVDHKLLNDIEGLENPTCEVIAMWFWNKIRKKLPQLVEIELWETETAGAVYKGPKV